MNRNTSKIKEGIRSLANQPYEIISGTVVAGSVDTHACTMSVRPSDRDTAIEGVLLNAITGSGDGMVIFPRDGSNVIIASVDGPGEWTLIKASEITKATITIGNAKYEMDNSAVNIQSGSVVFNVSTSSFKLNTASESLFQLLKDLITGITLLTVGTSTGPSSVPVNVATFNGLITRLSNLLSA